MPNEPTLGEILGAALYNTSVEHERERQAEDARRVAKQKATGRTIQVRTDKVITEVVDLVIPQWIELALQGSRIDAIKELRALTDIGNANDRLSLIQAKRIVETLIISKRYEKNN